MPGRYQKRKSVLVPSALCLIAAMLLLLAPDARARTVRLPMSIDMPLLTSLIAKQAFRQPGSRALLTANDGCNEIWLNAPQLSMDRGLLRVQTMVDIHAGTPIAGKCFAPMRWQGAVVLWQLPVLDAQWRLHFQIKDSTLLDTAGKPATVANLIWDLVKDRIHSYLGGITIDFAPPVQDLKEFLLTQTGNSPSDEARQLLASMRPEQPKVTRQGLQFDILADTPIQEEQPSGGAGNAPMASPEARDRLIALWQSSDALLVQLVEELGGKPLTEQDQQLLLDTMLTSRYAFNDALNENRLSTAFVRHQFIGAWNRLKPLFRHQLTTGPENNPLGYLSFFTAADALTSLDRIGPSIGIEISRAGFDRMARMLGNLPLNEGGAVDPLLRRVLGLGVPLAIPTENDSSGPQPENKQQTSPPPPQDKSDQPGNAPTKTGTWNLRSPRHWLGRQLSALVFPSRAHAAKGPSMDEVRRWMPDTTPAAKLLPRINQLLIAAASSQQKRLRPSNGGDTGWFQRVIRATAWQESCLNQFVVSHGKITYLLSYNHTSVGLMQVNEKVWRGLYDVQALRWNIRYNGMAGAEILALYLNRYLAKENSAKRRATSANHRYLATWLYTLYNGGPAQLKKFPARQKRGKLYKSEKLFQAKYDKAAGKNWLAAVDCLKSH